MSAIPVLHTRDTAHSANVGDIVILAANGLGQVHTSGTVIGFGIPPENSANYFLYPSVHDFREVYITIDYEFAWTERRYIGGQYTLTYALVNGAWKRLGY